jgi:hypothetical protein
MGNSNDNKWEKVAEQFQSSILGLKLKSQDTWVEKHKDDTDIKLA